MKISKSHVKKLVVEGIDASTHHATIKKTYKELFGESIGANEVQTIRDLMNGDISKQEVPTPTQKELLANAREYLSKIGQKSDRVLEVTEVTAKGNPARVIVKCIDPQTNGSGDSVCANSREVSIQDVFQVVRCIPCQKRTVQIYRNKLARMRRQELRERRAS